MIDPPKRALKARDIERLENTSFASALAPGVEPAPEVLPLLQILGETDDCSYSCAGECSCGCISWACCFTMECVDDLMGGETWDCHTAKIDARFVGGQ